VLHVAAAQERDNVVLRVRDNGAGIAPELLPHIFDPFAQGPQQLARAQGGLGLGLAIVQRLVTLHGGEVAAHSEGPGRGSELVVRLPSARDEMTRPTIEASKTSRDDEPLPLTQQRLLIVDDNRDAAEILAEGLSMVGYEVRVTHDGPAALAVASSFRPALVLLDLGLPEMDGYEVAARLRGQPRGAGLRLIALTGHGQNTDRTRTRAAGFDEHLVKPVSLERLAAVLARLAPGADAS
jgi:CheY-like chemotaxis protein